MLQSARRNVLALALALAAAASLLPAPASAATRLVRNVATVSHGAAGAAAVNSNEVTVEVGSAAGGGTGGGAATLTLYSDKATTLSTPYLLLGTTGYLKLDARACGNDPAVVQTRIATLTTSEGDSEQLLATETAADSGIFLLAPVPTRRGPPQPGSGQIETAKGATATVTIQGCDSPVSVDFALIDPVGIVFDSVTGTPVDGLEVSLFKADGASCTRELATVSAPDEAGAQAPSPNPYRTRDGGRYQFPYVAPGSYCLQVASTAAYSFPSSRALASQMPGRVSNIGSLGLPFAVGPEPVLVAIDLPVDPVAAKLALFVNKKASRDAALAGEQLQFTVMVKNMSAGPVSHLTLRDAMSTGLTYLAGSLRINDAAAADPKAAAGSLAIALPDLAPGKSHTVSYRTALSPSAPSSVRNAASATAAEGTSNTASVRVEVRRGFETDSQGVLTGTVYLACQAGDPNANPGMPGIRLLLEDGTGVVTDNLGRYSRYGLRSGTHVLKVDPTSLPEHAKLAAPDGAGLAFIDLKDGELFKRNFALECTEEAQEQAKARAAAPVTDEVFGALNRTFSAAVSLPGVGGASSLSSTGTGSARELPAPGGARDAFGSSGREAMPGGSERTAGPAGEAARTPRSIVPAADQATALETALLAIETNEAAFINLQDDQVLAASTISVQVKAPMESTLVVALDGVPLDEKRIGQRSLYRDKAVMGIEYVGVKLKPGSNVLTLEQKDQFGNVRRKASVQVRAPGDLARISIAPVVAPLYAGEGGPSLIRIRLLDAEGVPVTARLPVTLETETGKWLAPEGSARAGAVELFVEGGQADVAITRPVQAMRIPVTATSGKVSSSETLDFVPQLRPFIGAGVAETLIRVKSGQALTVAPTTSLDAFSRELQGLSHQFGSKADAAARVAMFLKGKVKGDYLLTLAYDSDKPSRERLFRDISPDEFYPVYGDNSTRTFDAQSASKLYVRIEKEHSWALVGDFVTQPVVSTAPKAVLSSYTRPVTGAATHIEEGGVVVDAFALRDTTRQQVFEFEPNGTSGPYPLPSANLLANTERVELVVRDRLNPAAILERTTLVRFDDYELEALSGRILFKAPVSHFDANQNLVFVRVTFEVDTGQAAYTTFGGQISTRLGESATVAARVVHEGNPASPYTVQGVIAQVDVTPKLKVSAELARTRRGTDTGTLAGSAGRIEVKGAIAAVELSATATATSRNFENLSSGISPNRRDVAVTAALPLDNDSRLVARLTAGKDVTTGALNETAYAGVETPLTPNLRLEAGVRHLKERTAVFGDAVPEKDPQQQATTARVKLSVQMEHLPELTGSVEAEQSLDRSGGREAAVAVNYQLSSGTKVYARHELVNTLPVLSSASTSRQTTAIGLDTAYSTTGRAFAELRQTTTQGLSGPAAAYGVRESWEPLRGVRLTGGIEKVQVLGGPEDLGRSTNAVAVTSAVDVNIADDWRANGRIERATGSAENSLLATAGLAYKLSPAWTALARQVYYRTQGTTADAPVRVQSRLQLGMAWRSVQDDALLLLERYREPLEAGDRDSAIVSAQYGRALTTSLRMSARVAGRRSLETMAGASNRSYAALAGGRLSYEVTSKWNLGLQAQLVAGTGSKSAGLGLEAGYKLTDSFWVVAGYNWMSATDPVLQGPQFSRGAYVRIRYMFDETVLDAFPKMEPQ